MYRTADSLEDLDIEMELNSFDSVGHVLGRSSFLGIDEKYHNVDFYIIMIDDTEEEAIIQLLNSCGWTAWLEYDLKDELKMVMVD